MSKLKTQFNRVGSDASQLQKFANEVCENFSNEEGEWIDPSEAGLKLYKHTLMGIGAGGPPSLEIINTSSEKITNDTEVAVLHSALSMRIAGITNRPLVLCLDIGADGTLKSGNPYYIGYSQISDSEAIITTATGTISTISDTVTPL